MTPSGPIAARAGAEGWALWQFYSGLARLTVNWRTRSVHSFWGSLGDELSPSPTPDHHQSPTDRHNQRRSRHVAGGGERRPRGVGFLAICDGLTMLTTFITAMTAHTTQFIILAAVIFGGWIAVRVFTTSGH